MLMLTLFSEPAVDRFFKLKKAAKNSIKSLLGKKVFPYSGHYAVVRSVLAGLAELKIPHNYNPSQLKDVGEHIHVLANIHALAMAVRLKKAGRIKRLTAGPNIVISSAEHSEIIGAPEIDLYTVNSPWTSDAYVFDNRKLEGKIDYWYAGIDPDIWNVQKLPNPAGRPRVLFYLKRPEWKLVGECMELLDKLGIGHDSIHYGSYTIDEFKEKLSQTDCVIFFVEQESQGIALFEIWSTDTPTLVWNPGYWQYKMKNYRSSSAPYLTEKTGAFFRDVMEFETCVQQKVLAPAGFAPRSWILQYGSDREATSNFLKVIGYNI
jgi:hypothetical protein